MTTVVLPLGPPCFLKMNLSPKKGTQSAFVGILWILGWPVTITPAISAIKVLVGSRRRPDLAYLLLHEQIELDKLIRELINFVFELLYVLLANLGHIWNLLCGSRRLRSLPGVSYKCLMTDKNAFYRIRQSTLV